MPRIPDENCNEEYFNREEIDIDDIAFLYGDGCSACNKAERMLEESSLDYFVIDVTKNPKVYADWLDGTRSIPYMTLIGNWAMGLSEIQTLINVAKRDKERLSRFREERREEERRIWRSL